jgi:folate-binding protein YgfZ
MIIDPSAPDLHGRSHATVDPMTETSAAPSTALSELPVPSPQGAARLDRLGVIRVEGADAASFLHGQLTQDFALLGLSESRLAGFCSAKGRLLASFIGFKRSHEDILLVCHRDLLPATLKRLSMFVLRAKAKLSDASEAFQVWGLAQTLADGHWPATVWGKTEFEGASVVRLHPASGIARALWVAPADQAAPAQAPLSEDQWDWLSVMSGVVLLSQPVVEAFVPQMLNYESVGGVNFKKGCYPGQEVVARSQFRGTLKRRTYLMQATAPLAAGQEVFAANDPEQPVGMVAQAAPAPGGGWAALVSMQIAALNAGGLRAGSADGPALSVEPLPYPLLEDI